MSSGDETSRSIDPGTGRGCTAGAQPGSWKPSARSEIVDGVRGRRGPATPSTPDCDRFRQLTRPGRWKFDDARLLLLLRPLANLGQREKAEAFQLIQLVQ